ncbi:hypothetical protein BDQ17DRAFT_1336976 [Cyathus striatus]|nr:hypothetical protein BDQ17DRAFT_1336976 [Cyathus striatus]
MDISNVLPDLQISFLIPDMSSNQFQNTRVFFYAIGMSDGLLRSYIINSTKFPACLYGLDYPDKDSIITSQLCHKVDEIERYINRMLIVSWLLEIMARPVKGANRGEMARAAWGMIAQFQKWTFYL